MRFEVFISRRYFISKPRKTILSLITLLSIAGVTIGVSALIVVIGVMSGFESDLRSRIMGIEPHLVIDRPDQRIHNHRQLVQMAEGVNGVHSAWPVEELQVMLRTDGRVSGAVLKGVDPAGAAKGLQLKSLEKLLPASDPERHPQAENESPPMIMGRDLARNLGLIQGDSVFVVSPKGFLAPIGFVPHMRRFEVVAFFQTGMHEYDGSLVFIRLEDAQALSQARGSAGAIEVRVNDIFRTSGIERQIKTQLDETYRLRDWGQLNKNLFSALKLEKTAMFITLSLIILVATFSITSSLVMLVGEKTKDIAILRAMGATAKSIKRIFVLQGVLIGTLGTVSGVFLGTMLCFLQDRFKLIRLPGDVYYITALPVDLKLIDVTMVAIAAFIISYLATLYPAGQASRFNPVEVIRYG
jgi:lipoprotein-releasing system permease protein